MYILILTFTEDIGKLAIGRHLSRGGKVAAEQPERAFNRTRHKWD